MRIEDPRTIVLSAFGFTGTVAVDTDLAKFYATGTDMNGAVNLTRTLVFLSSPPEIAAAVGGGAVDYVVNPDFIAPNGSSTPALLLQGSTGLVAYVPMRDDNQNGSGPGEPPAPSTPPDRNFNGVVVPARAYEQVQHDPTTLNGQVTDPAGRTLTYVWDGPGVWNHVVVHVSGAGVVDFLCAFQTRP